MYYEYDDERNAVEWLLEEAEAEFITNEKIDKIISKLEFARYEFSEAESKLQAAIDNLHNARGCEKEDSIAYVNKALEEL